MVMTGSASTSLRAGTSTTLNPPKDAPSIMTTRTCSEKRDDRTIFMTMEFASSPSTWHEETVTPSTYDGGRTSTPTNGTVLSPFTNGPSSMPNIRACSFTHISPRCPVTRSTSVLGAGPMPRQVVVFGGSSVIPASIISDVTRPHPRPPV